MHDDLHRSVRIIGHFLPQLFYAFVQLVECFLGARRVLAHFDMLLTLCCISPRYLSFCRAISATMLVVMLPCGVVTLPSLMSTYNAAFFALLDFS
jgi:hypothetical protein